MNKKHRFENSEPLSNSEWKSLWRMKIHERLKLLLWKLVWNSFPTRENLGVRFHVESLKALLCWGICQDQKINVTLRHVIIFLKVIIAPTLKEFCFQVKAIHLQDTMKSSTTENKFW